jgi:hypothetical protein
MDNPTDHAAAIMALRHLYAILQAAVIEAGTIKSDQGVVAIERAGLVIMCEMRMSALENTIRRISQGRQAP